MRPAGIAIRPATEADLGPLARALAPLPLLRRYGFTDELLESRWAEAVRTGQDVWVAARGEERLGVCWFLREGTFATGAYLRTIAVAPAAQGSGVGALLLEAFESACPHPAGGWFLLVSDFNARAQRFYKRHGYREVGRLPDFALPGITEVVFWKFPPGPQKAA